MKKAIYVGYPGFPIGLAQVQRQMLIAKGLVKNGCNVLVLSRYGILDERTDEKISPTGTFEKIDYKFCSGTPFRPNKFLTRNLLKLKGFFNEIAAIFNEKKRHNADVIIITSNNFRGILFYTLLAKVINLTSVVDQVEYWSAQKSGLKKRIDSYLNDRYYFVLSDKIIVISDFLLSKIKQNKHQSKVIKIPAICDFTKFSNTSKSTPEFNYFLYCGSANYFEVVKFILDAYALLNTNVNLILIVSGNQSRIDMVKNHIEKNNMGNTFIKSNVPYDELVDLYKNSLALLIPLRPTFQDIARFPHKLGEYTAAGRPIVSTNIGEVSNYFKDGVNAFLSEKYDVNEFSTKMKEVIEKPDLREKIAHQSYITGKNELDYQKNINRLYKFLCNN